MKLWISPHSNPYSGRLWIQNRSTQPRTKNRFRVYLDRHVIVKYVFYPLMVLLSYVPSWNKLLMRIISPLICQASPDYVDRSDRILQTGYLPPHIEAEYSVPINRTEHYCNAVIDMFERNGHKFNICVEVRFVAADDIWLSCSIQSQLNKVDRSIVEQHWIELAHQ